MGNIRNEFRMNHLLDYIDELGTQDSIREIIYEYMDGSTYSEIASKHGYSAQNVGSIIRHYRNLVYEYLEWRKKIKPGEALAHITEIGLSKREQEALLMFASGDSIKQISEHFQTVPALIVRALKAFSRADYEAMIREKQELSEHGEFLKTLRIQNGYTINQLADSLGLSQKAIMKAESGRKSPSMNFLVSLSALYGVPLKTLLRTRGVDT